MSGAAVPAAHRPGALQVPGGVPAPTLRLAGSEVLDLSLPHGGAAPGGTVDRTSARTGGTAVHVPLGCRSDTVDEGERLARSGVLPSVWRRPTARARMQGAAP